MTTLKINKYINTEYCRISKISKSVRRSRLLGFVKKKKNKKKFKIQNVKSDTYSSYSQNQSDADKAVITCKRYKEGVSFPF